MASNKSQTWGSNDLYTTTIISGSYFELLKISDHYATTTVYNGKYFGVPRLSLYTSLTVFHTEVMNTL